MLVVMFTVALTPTPTTHEVLTGVRQSTSVSFPDSLTFSLVASAPEVITGAEVRYQVEQLSCGSGTASGFANFTPISDLNVSWEWDLKQRAGLPVGSRITYWWVLTSDNRSFETQPTTMVFEDPRFQWRTITGDHTHLLWYEGSQEFAEGLLEVADAGIRTLQKNTGVLPSKPVEVHIYENAAMMREAIVFSQEWTGGVAYPSQGLVSMGINESNLEWGRRATVHEMSHVVIAEASFTCGSGLPAWLDEGLATFVEGPEEPLLARALDRAVRDNSAFAVRGLAGSFPVSQDGAKLAYAESRDLVAFLLEHYGTDRMNALLTAFRELGTIDRALTQAYGFDTEGLERLWRADVGLPERAAPQDAMVEPLPMIPTLGGLPQQAEATATVAPTEPTATVGPAEATATSHKSSGSGCNRTSDETAGLDFGALAGLALGAIVIGRRLV
jgi:hypothetical protein